jgi:poly-gamma-glutamate capsule biosynthesis protein CapA/YwtB (metallophosphatase superfamily)
MKINLYRTILLCLLLQATFYCFAQEDTLSLLFAGDIMNNQAMLDAACIEKDKKYDYTPCFKYISPILESADLAIGNLELTLPGAPPYTGFPKFRSPEAYAKALRKAGFDVLVTANNHSNDSGPAGVAKTIDILRRQGFIQTGTFKNAAERKVGHPLLVKKNGFTLALLNYTHHTNGIATKPPVIVNRIPKTEQIKKDMAAARALKADFIIVFLHWGEELFTTENAAQRNLAKTFIAEGANLIVGAHPHVVQPLRTETVTTKTGEKSALVAYSLGNFISNMYQTEASGSVLLRVQLVKTRNQAGARMLTHDFAPIWRYIHKPQKGRHTYYVLPVLQVERNAKLVPGMPEAERRKMSAWSKSVISRLKVRKS